MIKILAAVRRKPGMTHAEFLEYIEHEHGRIAKAKPLGVKRYVQNHVIDSAFGVDADIAYTQTFHRDSITELFFADMPGLIQTFSDPYTQQTTGPDAENFADLSQQAAQLMDEVEASTGGTGPLQWKAMIFIKKNPAVTLDSFFTAWDLAHDAIAGEHPGFQQALRRHIRSKYLPEGDRVTAYFGPNVAVYEGVSSLWFENEADLSSFRQYQRALFQRLSDEGVAASSESFFVYVKEVVILDL
ncbi:EthD domain-containing protein [Pseudomonas fluorescens]|uniref:EthD domain-containing protein n=1 Tax=Pseudomonas fluorescens TaxID=294 RepID=A0A944DIL2_PSEFL|nr:EthD domain-containing protein [Pseudomonas fluorescens]MBT2297415.1 EthD domain-containing protein [Pseudomonas fluorescens]MBT2305613.1 EthD domain-containing protein [Pseudomonas fluorescens]MBT2314364.1 EthD domain-containing protein [Pseudomonas fluorescens]MBT2319144.1 EthD domain-containing protein [Pseudomonas fluorescens]MBT2328583.1 EthD domain-containing protein [Pseudomonas fluorescens]